MVFCMVALFWFVLAICACELALNTYERMTGGDK